MVLFTCLFFLNHWKRNCQLKNLMYHLGQMHPSNILKRCIFAGLLMTTDKCRTAVMQCCNAVMQCCKAAMQSCKESIAICTSCDVRLFSSRVKIRAPLLNYMVLILQPTLFTLPTLEKQKPFVFSCWPYLEATKVRENSSEISVTIFFYIFKIKLMGIEVSVCVCVADTDGQFV